jgi:hypothetical protein
LAESNLAQFWVLVLAAESTPRWQLGESAIGGRSSPPEFGPPPTNNRSFYSKCRAIEKPLRSSAAKPFCPLRRTPWPSRIRNSSKQETYILQVMFGTAKKFRLTIVA